MRFIVDFPDITDETELPEGYKEVGEFTEDLGYTISSFYGIAVTIEEV